MTDVFNASTLRGNQRITSNQLQGPPGSTITFGTALPNNALGVDKDVYLLEANDGTVLKTYQKDANSGVWLDIGAINPAWTSFSPTVTAGTGAITSFVLNTLRYQLIGKICFVQMSIWINAHGTGGGSIRVQLPVEPSAGASGLAACASVFASSGIGGCGFVETTATSLLGYPDVRLLKYDGTTLIADNVQTLASLTYETT